MPLPTRDLSGQRFGRLVALSRFVKPRGVGRTSATWWHCECDCGTSIEARAASLIKGITDSCGCLKRERLAIASTGHGGSGNPEYAIWAAMKSRCSNPNHISYPRYGGLGVRVCQEWAESYPAFLEHVGPRPSSAYSIDRIDPKGDYCPGNVRWSTVTQQNRNRKSTRLTPEIAAEIRARFVPRQPGNRGNSAALAAEYGISGCMVRTVAAGEQWAEGKA